ncbi:DUF7504 family protein [Halorussus halobius]|uniref:DUF7504 family protein n=1 Tax=Halorussus halobius TaxID=1710537 RepID=UPI0010929EEB|nr:hypothetical protein [Halorussus halobius]
MLISDAANPTDGNGLRLETLIAGEQVLVTTDGGTFELGALPDGAFENLLVVSVGTTARKMESRLRQLGRPLNSVGVVPVSPSTDDYTGPLWCEENVYPSDLTGVSIAFSRAYRHLREGRGWVVFDNLSVLLMYSRPERLHRLVDSFVRQCRSKGLRGVYVVDERSVEPSTVERFEQVVDRTLPARRD